MSKLLSWFAVGAPFLCQPFYPVTSGSLRNRAFLSSLAQDNSHTEYKQLAREPRLSLLLVMLELLECLEELGCL